ncbi:TonB-linked outer membrane protein, SusC/RagA family [Sphingobacterium nematocida]|uniref:TonB-linked outer membrane protein, SusC/RagA family n=2 Tax=Sphingobacterium nematocida TaxID=1513896 RepID=A0A1T5BPB3_9SPHI|nr:TonB-linked outer membrane protein, SusC/RagA family [Sphingobacterium nematocida]
MFNLIHLMTTTRPRYVWCMMMLCAACLLQVNSVQAQRVSVQFKNSSVKEVIQQLSQQYGYQFIFDADLLKEAKPITRTVEQVELSTALELLFQNQPFAYRIDKNRIVLSPKRSTRQKTYIVSGRVLDSLGKPIAGVSIHTDSPQEQTLSAENGSFELSLLAEENTLYFHHMSYNLRSLPVTKVNAERPIVILLSLKESMLNEVMITGYQTIPRERSTGSFVHVKNDQLNKQINTDLLSALEGQVSGLVYTKNPFGMGPDEPVLRGIGTYSTTVGTSPLIVMDNLPTELGLSDINPYDVESVTVLKDASAASIYGARAANGVIIVTTKKGKGQGVKVNANIDFFITEKPDITKLNDASTADLIDFEMDVYARELSRYANTQSLFANYGSMNNGSIRYYSPLYDLYRRRDLGEISSQQFDATILQWKQNDYYKEYTDQVWQNQTTQRYNANISQSGSRSNTYASFNYSNADGRIRHNNNKSFNLNLKSSFTITNWLSATIGLNGNYTAGKETEQTYNDYRLQPRYARILNQDGSRYISPYIDLASSIAGPGAAVNGRTAEQIEAHSQLRSTGFNILDALEQGVQNFNRLNLRAFTDLEAKITKGLSYQVMFSYELGQGGANSFYDKNDYAMRMLHNGLVSYTAANNTYRSNLPDGGRFFQYNDKNYNYTFRNQLNYNGTFGTQGQHQLTALAGFEMRQTKTPPSLTRVLYGYDPVTLNSINIDWATASENGFQSYVYSGNNRFSNPTFSKLSNIHHRYVSAYANAGYTYDGRINLTGSVRVDQADLFGVDPKYRYRPLWSMGAGWNISNESFLQDHPIINVLKARATYGITGNIDQTTFPHSTAAWKTDRLYTSLRYLEIANLPNPKLRWEKTSTWNFGIDYALLDNRLMGSIEYYNRYSSDLLVNSVLDPTVGALSRRLNNGALRNRGIELSVTGTWLKTTDWRMSSTLVYAHNSNKVDKVSMAASTAASYVGAPTNYFFEGQPFNSLMAYRYGGMTEGYPYFLDENGIANTVFDANGVPTSIKSITSKDALVYMGSLNPTYSGSFNQRISYKSFDLSAMLVYSGGNKLRKDVIDINSNVLYNKALVNRWSQGGSSDYPRLLVDYPENKLTYASTSGSMWRNADVHVLDADYIKLRNIVVGYNLPNTWVRKAGLANAKIMAQINNLWYWSAAGDGIDPEVYSLNSGTRAMPNPKTYVLGINVNF